MNLGLCPESVFKKLFYLIIILLFLNIFGLILKFYFDHDYIYGLVPLFDFDTERNVPTLYSSFALLTTSLILLLIVSAKKKMNLPFMHWAGLSIVFIYLIKLNGRKNHFELFYL